MIFTLCAMLLLVEINFTLSIRLLEIDSFWTFVFYRKAVAKAKEAHKKHEAEVPFYLPTTCSPMGIL